jgi:hypothetical protein
VSLQSKSILVLAKKPPEEYTDKDKKVVKIYPDLHEALGKLVQEKGDSFDIIIRRLVNFYEERQKK